jgi:probable HAF family extracellular repeat protein
MKSGKTLVLCAGWVLIVSSVGLAAPPSFQGLGGQGLAWGISADGSTVVGGTTAGGSLPPLQYEAFRWQNGVMSSLGDLPGGDTKSRAYAVSADGSVVVGYALDAAGQVGFRWANGEMSPLPGVGGTAPRTLVARGVSADGSVVVGGLPSVIGPRGFRWENGVTTTLGMGLPQADAVSADGSVVIGWGVEEGAYRWENGVVTSLGSLYPWGLSANGSVVVGAGATDALRWESGTITSLGPGLAMDASADGSIIVGTKSTLASFLSGDDGDPNGFIWTPQLGYRDLRDFLTNDCGLDLTGWGLLCAKGVSDDGLTICGDGINPAGLGEPWIAHIPEPGLLTLVGVGSMWLSGRRRRIRS